MKTFKLILRFFLLTFALPFSFLNILSEKITQAILNIINALKDKKKADCMKYCEEGCN